VIVRMAEEPLCPICCEVLDATDQNFYPCQCNYQICLWCYQRISEGPSPLCPACRTPYDKNKVNEAPSKKVIEQARDEQRRKRIEERREQRQEKEKRPPTTISGPPPALAEKLANEKVRQRNLVYVTGIPVQECREETLRRTNWFGQFGRIISCVTKNDSAYITYQKASDAEAAIAGMHGRPTSDNRALRCAVGTTKYCSFFLRRQECPNPNCLYLHEIARTEDTVSSDDIGRNPKFDYDEMARHYENAHESPIRQGYIGSAKPPSMGRNTSAPTPHPRHVNSLPPSSLFESSLQPMLTRHKSMPDPSIRSNSDSVITTKPPRLRAPPPGFSSQNISENNNISRSESGLMSNTSLNSQIDPPNWPPMPTNSVDASSSKGVIRGVHYADDLPHAKQRPKNSGNSFDFKAIWQSLMTKEHQQIQIANLAALSYTSSNILESLQPRTSSRFNFVSHPEKKTYDFNTNESVIQKLLSSTNLNPGNSSSLYGSSSFF